ncbi:MAG: hypothetical protein M3112_09760 [Actinomycetia bacterium]|nr:hypothetical protein [Actinomycetes bacterium]
MFTWSAFVAVLIRPHLWPAAVGTVFDLAPMRWWTKFPFVPIPDDTVMKWRVTTAYGQSDMTLAAVDVVSYLRWRRAT